MAVILTTGFGLWLVRHWQAKPVPVATPEAGLELPALPDCEDEE
jgi:hypothetical protein